MEEEIYIVDYKKKSHIITNCRGLEESIDDKLTNQVCVGQIVNRNLTNTFGFIINPIVGTLHLSSKRIYSTKKSGQIRKEFTPFFHFLPQILVKTTRINLSSDVFAVVNIDGFENGNFVGTVQKYIENDETTESNNDIVTSLASSHWSKKIDKIFNEYVYEDLTSKRIDLTQNDIEIYTIDPEGCIDNDDAIHISQHDKQWEIGIHIADVSSFFPIKSACDIELSKRCETFYGQKIMHMIPESIVKDAIALVSDGKNKRAFSVILLLNESFDIMDIQFVKTLIKITKNISYNEAEILKHTNKNIKNIYEIGKAIKTKYFLGSFDPEEPYDSHQMIAVYMLLANFKVAEKISKYDKNNVLLRAHKQQMNYSKENTEDKYLKKIKKMYMLSTMNKAYYQIGCESSRHSGLNLDTYTHFTSPIRRYADIIVHRQLWKCINDLPIDKIEPDICFRMNIYSKIYSDVERYSSLLNIISGIDNEVFECEAHIINIKLDLIPIAQIYIPKLDIRHNVILCQKKLLHVIKIESNESSIILSNLQYPDTYFELFLFQKISILVSITHKNLEKINVSITDPKVTDVFCL